MTDPRGLGKRLRASVMLGMDKLRALYYRTKSAAVRSAVYRTRPTLKNLLGDPLVNAELWQAWYESNPHALEVPRGQGGSLKREQGGFIYWNHLTGRLEIDRLPPGSRDGLAGLPAGAPGRELVGGFHTHPNTTAEGYGPDPSPADRHFTRSVSRVPELIETHAGRKTIEFP